MDNSVLNQIQAYVDKKKTYANNVETAFKEASIKALSGSEETLSAIWEAYNALAGAGLLQNGTEFNGKIDELRYYGLTGDYSSGLSKKTLSLTVLNSNHTTDIGFHIQHNETRGFYLSFVSCKPINAIDRLKELPGLIEGCYKALGRDVEAQIRAAEMQANYDERFL